MSACWPVLQAHMPPRAARGPLRWAWAAPIYQSVSPSKFPKAQMSFMVNLL